MRSIQMRRGARTLVEDCTNLKAGEKVVIVTDMETTGVAEVVAAACMERKAETVVIVMEPREIDGQEPPEVVASALKKADVIFTPVKKSITHTTAVKEAVAGGARAIMLTAFTEDMMISGGIEADFAAIKPISLGMADLFAKAKTVRVTTPGGTDLTMSIEGRPGNAHYGIVGPGQMSTVPNIEASVSPVEGTASGVFVADASIPYFDIGLLREPIKYTVENGAVVRIEGGAQAQEVSRMMEKQNDKNVYNIAQFSFGLNPKCRMQGLMLEDEGVYGTVHIGIGTSTSLGGKIKTAMHYDALMWSPTVWFDDEIVMKDGELTKFTMPK